MLAGPKGELERNGSSSAIDQRLSIIAPRRRRTSGEGAGGASSSFATVLNVFSSDCYSPTCTDTRPRSWWIDQREGRDTALPSDPGGTRYFSNSSGGSLSCENQPRNETSARFRYFPRAAHVLRPQGPVASRLSAALVSCRFLFILDAEQAMGTA